MMEKERDTRKLKQCDKVKLTALAMIMKQAGYPYSRSAELFGVGTPVLSRWGSTLYRDESMQLYTKLINANRGRSSEAASEAPRRRRKSKEVTVYLSGAITGLKTSVVAKEFSEAEARLELLGFSVVNPLSNGLSEKHSWGEHMRADIALMLDCEAIYIVNNIVTSKGAKLELSIAGALGYAEVSYLWSDDKIRDVLKALRV